MKVLLLFFRGWLGIYFLLIHFVVPIYLVAIYPDFPEPAVRLMRGFGYGVVQAPPSEVGFWYRFLSCSAWVIIGLLLIYHHLREIAQSGETEEKAKRRSQRVA